MGARGQRVNWNGTELERFWRNIKMTETCWLWTGRLRPDGYAEFMAGGKRWAKAHRWFYELMCGPVPVGLELDHLCRVRHCVRPSHLEAVTRKINVRRGIWGLTMMDGMEWQALQYDDSELWLVADENDNPVAEDLIREHANLIAAAPKLLNALQSLMKPSNLLEVIDDGGGNQYVLKVTEAEYNAAQSALERMRLVQRMP